MKIFLSVLLFLLVSACSQLPQKTQVEVSFSTVESSTYSGITDFKTVVIRDSDAWRKIWIDHVRNARPQNKPLPVVDFARNEVVGIFIGARSKGCYDVRIKKVYSAQGITNVEYTELVPFANKPCTFEQTSPVHLITIPKTEEPVHFVKLFDTPI